MRFPVEIRSDSVRFNKPCRRSYSENLSGLLLFTLLVPPGELSAWAQRTRTSRRRRAQTAPGFSISVTVPVVSVDVVVTDNNGNYLKDLKKENFRISEDGAVQTITNFAPSEAPITIVLLLDVNKNLLSSRLRVRSDPICWVNYIAFDTFPIEIRSVGFPTPLFACRRELGAPSLRGQNSSQVLQTRAQSLTEPSGNAERNKPSAANAINPRSSGINSSNVG